VRERLKVEGKEKAVKVVLDRLLTIATAER